MTTLLKSATIIDSTSPHNLQTKDILIIDGFIEKIEDSIEDNSYDNVIELPNLHVSCGWFDSSVSFGEPGLEERETISNGIKVAAKSGFTAIGVNPNTRPITETKSDVEFIINKAKDSAVDLHPIGALTQKSKGIEMAELYDMQQSGARAFGDYNKPIENDNLMKIALLYAQNFDGLVISFPKNNSIAGEGVVNEGINSTKLGLNGTPDLAEHLQIARDLYLLEYTGGKLHIPTISTAQSVELIREAKKKGLNITCSVSVHHLTLTDDKLEGFDSSFKVTPPLRTQKDVTNLIEAVKDGTIDVITSDHNPIDIENKKLEFSLALDGTTGLESAFGILRTVLNPEEIVNAISRNPRNIFGLNPLSIDIKKEANLTLFNPDTKSIFSLENILSSSKNSAFINQATIGKVYGVIANNKIELN